MKIDPLVATVVQKYFRKDTEVDMREKEVETLLQASFNKLKKNWSNLTAPQKISLLRIRLLWDVGVDLVSYRKDLLYGGLIRNFKTPHGDALWEQTYRLLNIKEADRLSRHFDYLVEMSVIEYVNELERSKEAAFWSDKNAWVKKGTHLWDEKEILIKKLSTHLAQTLLPFKNTWIRDYTPTQLKSMIKFRLVWEVGEDVIQPSTIKIKTAEKEDVVSRLRGNFPGLKGKTVWRSMCKVVGLEWAAVMRRHIDHLVQIYVGEFMKTVVVLKHSKKKIKSTTLHTTALRFIEQVESCKEMWIENETYEERHIKPLLRILAIVMRGDLVTAQDLRKAGAVFSGNVSKKISKAIGIDIKEYNREIINLKKYQRSVKQLSDIWNNGKGKSISPAALNHSHRSLYGRLGDLIKKRNITWDRIYEEIGTTKEEVLKRHKMLHPQSPGFVGEIKPIVGWKNIPEHQQRCREMKIRLFSYIVSIFEKGGVVKGQRRVLQTRDTLFNVVNGLREKQFTGKEGRELLEYFGSVDDIKEDFKDTYRCIYRIILHTHMFAGSYGPRLLNSLSLTGQVIQTVTKELEVVEKDITRGKYFPMGTEKIQRAGICLNPLIRPYTPRVLSSRFREIDVYVVFLYLRVLYLLAKTIDVEKVYKVLQRCVIFKTDMEPLLMQLGGFEEDLREIRHGKGGKDIETRFTRRLPSLLERLTFKELSVMLVNRISGGVGERFKNFFSVLAECVSFDSLDGQDLLEGLPETGGLNIYGAGPKYNFRALEKKYREVGIKPEDFIVLLKNFYKISSHKQRLLMAEIMTVLVAAGEDYNY